jgi:transcriptional regulator with XRE-family HTH domain
MADKLAPNLSAFYSSLGAKIRQLREHDPRGIKQEDIARQCGMSRLSYLLLEKGSKKISVHQLYLIADVLQIDIDKLLFSKNEALDKLKKSNDIADKLSKKIFSEKRLDEIISRLPRK